MKLFDTKKNKIQRLINFFNSQYATVLQSLPAETNPIYLSIQHGIASTISTLDLGVYQYSKGRPVRQWDHMVSRLINKPNIDDTETQFIYRMVQNYLDSANIYMAVSLDGTSMILLNPKQMKVSRSGQAPFNKIYNYPGLDITKNRIIHIYNPQYYDGIKGHSILEINSSLIELHSALLLYMNTYFNQSAGERLAITLDENTTAGLKDADVKVAFETWITEKIIGAVNAGKPLLLNPGMKVENIKQTTNVEAELSSLINKVEQQIANLYGYPTYKLTGDYGNNLQDQQINYLQNCILPITEVIQEGMSKLLINPFNRDADYMKVRFTYDNLLMPNIETRHKILRDDKRGGLITIDEARSAIDMPKYDGKPETIGDVLWTEQNLAPAMDIYKDQYFKNMNNIKEDNNEKVV